MVPSLRKRPMPDVALKKGWTRVAFGDVVRQIRDRVDPDESGLQRFVAGEHMDTDDLRIRRWGTIGDGYLGPAFHMRFKPGHILYGSRRTYLRKVAVADFEGITANTTFVIEPKDPKVLLPDLLPFIMQTESFHEHSKKQSKGSVNPYVNFSDLTWYKFPLPPLEEQQRIAAACAEAGEVRERHRTLAVKSSVLLRACVGALAEEFTDSIQSIAALVKSQILADPQDGNHGERHPAASDYVVDGIPFLMATDIRNGRVDLAGCHFISTSVAENLRIGFAREGDVLLTHKGTLGQVAVLQGLHTDYALLTPQVTYYRVLDKSKLLPRYLYYAFQSAHFQRQMVSHGRQSTRSYVGITAQRTLSLPVPPLSVQGAIVERCCAIEAAGESALQRADDSHGMQRMIVRRALSECEA
jgi:type I restriction enzyme S subunit